MANKKVFIETWGCQLNYHRSEKIAGTLSDNEYNVVDSPGEADLIIFNTCAVRGKSEEKVLGRIGQIKGERKEDSVLGVGGCMAQHLGPDLFKISDGVDFIFGTSNISEIIELADKAKKEANVHSIPDPDGFEELPALRNQDHFAWVTIAEGCSNACSYCIVPQVRGPLRSRPPKQILEEIEHLVQENYKEIQLLGQNVNAFGQDIDEEDIDFAWLLKKGAEMGVPRISFTTPHPGDLKVKTLTVMREHPNIVRHIHLPLQSGSNRVLQIMNRGYTREEYLEKIEQARSIDPQVNITTDIIVGHPGETEKDFQKTLNLMKRVNFGSIYVAQFSPRPDTLSASMDDHVPEEEKKKRLQLVLDKQKKYSRTVGSGFNDGSTEVLVEGMAREDGKVYGKNEFGKTVTFDGNKSMIGQFKRVKYPAPEGKTCKADI
ncbi:tRNA (N6-isopentenyl adenosine(37)-C2)-methylthiotransferase MiaB [Candidatus Bipolaricaulota bacterium]|nr:tRNA (N6-isopentenyl adenosine(37)-C2)-methylthiotransferase MiaB [Candidatus Bipolaricaulota bacterium]